MPGRTALIIFLMLLCTRAAVAQSGKDSLAIVNVTDTSYVDYDELFDELEHFLDSITAPRDLTMFNIGVVSSYFNYESKSTYVLEASRKLLYIPTVAFYSRTGFGIGVTALVVNDGKNINPFQMYFTGSYDYLANRKFLTGISYSRYLTKDSLPFYTSPLKNELYAYFTYRDFWVRPSVSVSYGWGSRTDYAQREEYINSLLLRPSGYTNINTQESISDLNITTSLRHDFYWLNTLARRDHIRLTPQVSFISGTQQFGLNQTTNTYATVSVTGSNVLYNTENVYLDNQLYFQPLSLAGFLKAEYGIGKFFVQPQVMFAYYIPAKDNNFSTTIVFNAGVIF